MQCIFAFLQFEHFTDCFIRDYQSILDQYFEIFTYYANTLAYFAFYYAGIFDTGLSHSIEY